MVNTGRPSKDCETCRQRRVKCDLRRPHCLRCEKIGRVCSGYRDLTKTNLAFRINTPTTFSDRATKKKQQRNSVIKSSDSPRQEGQPDKNDSSDSTERSSTSSLNLKGIVEPWDCHITPLILSQFSFPSPRGGRLYGSLECLSAVLGDVEPGSTLHLATKAVGYVYLANRSRSDKDELLHHKLYGQTLHSLQLALSDPKLQTKDHILLAVWLSCLYELMLGSHRDEPGRGPLNWNVHSKALVSLLRFRGSRQFDTKTGCQLFQLAYHYVQIQALQTNSAPSMESKEWFNMIKSSANVDELLFIPSFFYGDAVARLCRESCISFRQAETSTEKIAAIDGAIESFKKLQATAETSTMHVFQTSKSKPTPEVESPHKCQLGKLRVRNHVDACVLRVYSLMLELLFYTADLSDITQSLADHVLRLQEEIAEESRMRVSRILESLPYLFPENTGETPSWAEALRLMWPTRMVYFSTAADPDQKRVAKETLGRLADEVGIKQALGSFLPDMYNSLESAS